MQDIAYLHVGENLFTGNLPDLSMPALKYLNVSHNALTGNIPSSISNLAVLDTLDLSNQANTVYDSSTGIRVTRGLTGQIPAEIGQVGFLQTLNLESNLLTGTMPDSLALLTYLGSMNLEDNFIGGQIPSSINILEQLGNVMLARNRLTGTIPDLGGSADVVRTVTMSGNPELLPPAPFKLCDLDDLDLRRDSTYCPAERSALAVSRKHVCIYCEKKIGKERHIISAIIHTGFYQKSLVMMFILILSPTTHSHFIIVPISLLRQRHSMRIILGQSG